MRDNVDEGDQALDSLFGPYDFLDSGLAQLPQSEPSSGRMSESPEDDKIRGQGVLDAFPDPTAGAMLPPEDRFQPVKSEEDRKPGSTDGSEVSSEQAQAPAPKRGRAGAPSGKQLQPPTKGELQDKADRCRARNREHARQTRRRKKEFVENLQLSVTNLTRENEAMAQRLREADARDSRRARRVETVDALLNLRVADDPQIDPDDPDSEERLWNELVEPDFELHLPHTPYRSFAPYEQTVSGRTVTGVRAAISDVKSLRTCLAALTRLPRSQGSEAEAAAARAAAAAARAALDEQRSSSDQGESGRQTRSGGRRSKEPEHDESEMPPQEGRAECVLERASVAWTADGTLLAPWVLRVANAEGRCVLSQRGTAKAMFRAAPRGVRGDRVARLELTFDTIGLWQQLTRASRSPVAEPYAAVPNTLEDALQDSKDARVVTSATRPFVIEHVNDAWVRLCGFSADEAVGKTLACLQGPLSERDEITKIVDQAARGHAYSALITNYTKQGQRFQNFLRVVPLVRGNDDAQPSHMLGVLQDVQPQLAG